MTTTRDMTLQATASERLSTRLVFCLGGITIGAWAPLVPVAKLRLGIDEGVLGILLLCMGLGSIVVMPLTGWLTSRHGCRQVITGAAAGLIAILPVLTLANTPATMAAALMAFGGAMGCLSVAMNLQAVLVERKSGKILMSGFHALFSLGGILGSAAMSALLGAGVAAPPAAMIVSMALAAILFAARPGLLSREEGDGEERRAIAMPKGIVVVIGVLALMAMLAEGAVLDWGALFLIETRGLEVALAGFGYTAFAATMTIGRLLGDPIRTRFGDAQVLFWSASLGAAGFVVALIVPGTAAGLAGFMLIGAGISNLMPILFTMTGKTRSMPANLALSSVFTVGYVGIIAGPAAVGFVAHAAGLQTAFWLLCLAISAIAASSRLVLARL